MTNAVFMPYVLEFNREAVADRVARLAACYCGLELSFDSFLQWSIGVARVVGVPHTIKELGVDWALADRVADMAIVDPTASEGRPGEASPATAHAQSSGREGR